MKRNIVVISIVSIIVVGAVTAWLVIGNTKQNNESNIESSSTPNPVTTTSDFNPNYADAIEQRKPELCSNINYALQSSPTDAVDKIYGDPAIELCKRQAGSGSVGCECNEEAVLSNMRKEQ